MVFVRYKQMVLIKYLYKESSHHTSIKKYLSKEDKDPPEKYFKKARGSTDTEHTAHTLYTPIIPPATSDPPAQSGSP